MSVTYILGKWKGIREIKNIRLVICNTMYYNNFEGQVFSMKDSTVSARVEYDIKTEAEDILQGLGIPVSVVINSLYRQIIYRRGVPGEDVPYNEVFDELERNLVR